MNDYRALIDEIEESRKKPFEWGQNDCVLFAARCHAALTGVDLGKQHVGEYNSLRSAKKYYAQFLQSDDITSYLDRNLTRLPRMHSYPRGAVVLREDIDTGFGWALGVSVGHPVAFVSVEGIVFFPIESGWKSWL